MTAVDRLRRSGCPVFAAYGGKADHKPKASCPLLALSGHSTCRTGCPLSAKSGLGLSIPVVL